MATPKNSAKPLGYENPPHACGASNKAVICLGVLAKFLVCRQLELACGAMPIRSRRNKVIGLL